MHNGQNRHTTGLQEHPCPSKGLPPARNGVEGGSIRGQGIAINWATVCPENLLHSSRCPGDQVGVEWSTHYIDDFFAAGPSDSAQCQAHWIGSWKPICIARAGVKFVPNFTTNCAIND